MPQEEGLFNRVQPVDKPALTEIAAEWDDLAAVRAQQIESGIDVSYNFVLAPAVESLLRDCDMGRVLDVGCGTGHLAAAIARRAKSVTGIDISKRSIAIARARFAHAQNVAFRVATCEMLSGEGEAFTVAYSNMMLMDSPDLQADVRAIATLLPAGGRFVLTIAHPCFWPKYWNYSSEPWFNYDAEIAVRAPFQITNDHSVEMYSTHIHRPLSMYADALENARFVIDRLLEPRPRSDAPAGYLESWRFPRFLAFRCVRT